MNLAGKITQLKKEKNVVILAHNYQIPEVQDIADFIGDSLGLSILASQTKADIILFCGVYFMAETAKILSPGKTVLIPDIDAGCPMADMITVDQLREMKLQHPTAKVLAYVNSPAEVKAEADVCCTSANAVYILKEAFEEDDTILFVPDKYLASYAASQTGRKIIQWPGYCPSHVKILPQQIIEKKQQHPEALVLVHPECPAAVIDLADAVLSTAQMLRYAKENPAKEFIIGTEVGMVYPLKKENPGKEFYAASDLAVCPNMKRITLEKVARSLEKETYKVELSQEIINRAKTSIEKMIYYRDKPQECSKA